MRIVALTGGVGGAKLCLGFARITRPEDLLFVVNTGDDFTHLGLRICPDIDTLTYTLAGIANPETGWGRRDETWHFMETLATLGGETWFQLGDRDLALHAYRTARLTAGASLTEVTGEIHARLGIRPRCVPMSDQPVATRVTTPAGELAFQHYFVRDRCEPEVSGFRFAGVESAEANPEVARWITAGGVRAVVICPSNPFVSIDPILAVPGMREALQSAAAPVIAVTPIIAGQAVKGPTAKMMAELDMPASATEVARHYERLIDGFVLDERDAAQRAEIEALGLAVATTDTWMNTIEDRERLARTVLEFAGALG